MAKRQAIKDLYQEQHLFAGRLFIAAAAVVLLMLVLFARLLYLQVGSYEHFTTLSQNNRVRLVAIPPPRGLIYDRHGVLLADNRPVYSLEITPEGVEDMADTLERLERIVALRPVDLERFYSALKTKRPFQGVPLRFNLSDEEVARFAVNRHHFSGVDIEARLNRYYPLEGLAAHAVGYVGRIDERELESLDPNDYNGTTHIGKLGVEKYYEDLLHGEVGYQQVEVNAQGRTLRVLARQPPVPGKDLVLSIDARLQAVAAEALGDLNGAVVAMDPRNGEVLALVSVPVFDPHLFVNGISSQAYRALNEDPNRPLFNRALTGQYPPGSTIKPFVGLAGLEYGATTPERTLQAGGYYMLPNDDRKYRDWKRQGHGLVDLDTSITQSCDVYFYDLAYRLGIDKMHEFLRLFGLGMRLGLDATGESAGLLPSREWKRRVRREPWFPGETLIVGIGQGYMLVTPLQLAAITGTLSLRGQRFRPHLLQAILSGGDGQGATQLVSPVAPEGLPRVEIRQAGLWDRVIQPMTHVMHAKNGTAYWTAGRTAAYRIAGKTGTAQVFGLKEDEEYDAQALERRLRDHSLFIAFAPVEDPRIAIAVVAENGGSGSAVAAPIARKVMDAYLLERAEDTPSHVQ